MDSTDKKTEILAHTEQAQWLLGRLCARIADALPRHGVTVREAAARRGCAGLTRVALSGHSDRGASGQL